MCVEDVNGGVGDVNGCEVHVNGSACGENGDIYEASRGAKGANEDVGDNIMSPTSSFAPFA